MRILRFIWRGVLAFDRIGSRIPQLIQIWLIEFFFALPLSFFVAKLIDIPDAFGVAGTGGSIPGVFWGRARRLAGVRFRLCPQPDPAESR
jgi:hypothetical protein